MPAPSSSLPALLEYIEIPDSAYEKAKARYEDIGRWLCRPESSLRDFDPAVFAQGSFLLGTVTRPHGNDGEYDLDLAIKLRRGVSKRSHTQEELKALVGAELEAYRKARGIEAELDEKRRCWRLVYRDDMSFHIDAVPCIPEDEVTRGALKEALRAYYADETLADTVARLTVAITDYEHDRYPVVCDDWNVSNPQGYGHWFAARVRLAERTVRDRLRMEGRATVEELPAYKLKAPLQRAVQLLKLHRDTMFEAHPDAQPISIIITTLAARAYGGEEDVTEALLHILDTMAEHVRDSAPRVPNPVNPAEDFADKWPTPEGRELGLEENFYRWVEQARADFRRLAETHDVDALRERAEEALGVKPSREFLQERFASTPAPGAPAVVPAQRIEHPPRPWAKG